MELRLLLLEALEGTENGGLVYAAVLGIAALAFLTVAFLPSLSGSIALVSRSRVDRRLLFYLTTVAFIVWARLPGLLSPHINPDEGIFTAAAVRLLHDPIFWRSVDTGSSGPLNVFPLTLPALAGFTPEFASSRLVGLLMITASTCLLYAALSRVYSDFTARLATIPVATTIALVQNRNFVHYSSEHVPVLWLSIILLLVCRFRASPEQHRSQTGTVIAIGFCSGLMPYTKMQGVPVALALCLILIHMLWLRYRQERRQFLEHCGWLASGAVVPSLFVVWYLSAFSIWDLFLNSYLQTNLFFYSGIKAGGVIPKLRNFVDLFTYTNNFYWLASVVGVFSLVGGAVFILRCHKNLVRLVIRNDPPYTCYAFVYLAAALFAVIRPGNRFPHYLLFLAMPSGFLIGTILGELRGAVNTLVNSKGRALRGAYVFLTLVVLTSAAVPVAARMQSGSVFLVQHSKYLQNYRGSVGDEILKVAPRGSSMSVWGFSANLFIESGLIQATRYGCTFWQTEKNPLQADFINEFVDDFERSRPLVFVDAMSPAMFYPSPVDRSLHGHDAFAPIAELIRRNYQLVSEIEGVRIYKRRGEL